MVTSASARDAFSSRSNFKVRIGVALDDLDEANNRSRWDYSLRVDNDSGTSATWIADGGYDMGILINGTDYGGSTPAGLFDFRDGDDYHNAKLGTSGYIAHNADGTKLFNIRGFIKSVPVFGSADTGNYAVAAPTIPRQPSAPGTPALSGASEHALTVTWAAATQNGSAIDKYDLYESHLSDDNVSWSADALVYSGLTRTQVISDLRTSRSHRFRVRAHNAQGYGGYSGYSTALRTLSGWYIGIGGSFVPLSPFHSPYGSGGGGGPSLPAVYNEIFETFVCNEDEDEFVVLG